MPIEWNIVLDCKNSRCWSVPCWSAILHSTNPDIPHFIRWIGSPIQHSKMTWNFGVHHSRSGTPQYTDWYMKEVSGSGNINQERTKEISRPANAQRLSVTSLFSSTLIERFPMRKQEKTERFSFVFGTSCYELGFF